MNQLGREKGLEGEAKIKIEMLMALLLIQLHPVSQQRRQEDTNKKAAGCSVGLNRGAGDGHIRCFTPKQTNSIAAAV